MGDLNRGTGIALWRQIEEVLRNEMTSGTLAQGSRLPTEQSLVERFGVNRHTIRRALASLQDQGLIRIEQGRGTFVHDNVIDYVLGRRTRFSQNLTRQSRTPASTLLRGLEAPADATVAEALEVPHGTAVIVLDTIGEGDGQRLCISSRYYPKGLAEGMIEAFRETRSVTEALRRVGIPDYYRKVTRITARLPSAEDARYLHLPKTRPVLVTESVSIDPKGRPIEYGLTRFASDRIQLVVES
jgi:GntR family phosphonate transport system transcriptional regulator